MARETHRIRAKHLYIVEIWTTPPTCGITPRPRALAVVAGARKRRDGLPDGVGPLFVDGAIYRLCDGHLPEFQPLGKIADVMAFLAANPYAEAVVVDNGMDTQLTEAERAGEENK